MSQPAPESHSGSSEVVGPARLRPAVRESWNRCLRAGLATTQQAPELISGHEVDPRLSWAASPALALLEASLSGEPVGILLCGVDGTIVSTLGANRGVRGAMDDVHLVPGCSTSEEVVGTNGMGLALREHRPWLMTGPEHFWQPLRGFTCAGVLVRDGSTGAVEGGLALVTPSPDHGHLLLALAGQTAAHIESRLESAPNVDARPTGGPRLSRFEELEQRAIAAALRAHGDAESAAAYLGLSRATVYRRIRRYGLRPDGR